MKGRLHLASYTGAWTSMYSEHKEMEHINCFSSIIHRNGKKMLNKAYSNQHCGADGNI